MAINAERVFMPEGCCTSENVSRRSQVTIRGAIVLMTNTSLQNTYSYVFLEPFGLRVRMKSYVPALLIPVGNAVLFGLKLCLIESLNMYLAFFRRRFKIHGKCRSLPQLIMFTFIRFNSIDTISRLRSNQVSCIKFNRLFSLLLWV